MITEKSIPTGSQMKTLTMIMAMETFEMNSKMRKLACEGRKRSIGSYSTTCVFIL
jgi:hypothetical protein